MRFIGSDVDLDIPCGVEFPAMFPRLRGRRPLFILRVNVENPDTTLAAFSAMFIWLPVK